MTPFGLYLRTLRQGRRMMLGDMADALKISAPYLSQIETGKKAIPDDLVDRIVRLLDLEADTARALRREAELSMKDYHIRLDRNADVADKRLAGELALGFARLPAEKKELLRNMLREVDDDE